MKPVIAALLLLLASVAPVGAATQPAEGPTGPAFGITLGLPVIFGPQAVLPWGHHMAIAAAFTGLGGFTVFQAQGQYIFRKPRRESYSLYAFTGLTQYFLSESNHDESPLGWSLGAGSEYLFDNRLGLGGEVGYLALTGSEKDSRVSRFSVHKGKTAFYANAALRYHL